LWKVHNADRPSLARAHDEARRADPYRGAMPLGVEVPAAGYERNAVTADQGDDEHGLRIDAVTVRFGGLTALEDVSLQVSPGEVVGVIGPNGAGKTTLFNVICGFVRPDGGDVVWRGRSLGAVRPHQLARLGIARTLQGVGLFAGLTALENVMAGAERLRRAGLASALLGLPRSDRDERALRAGALDALDALGVADVAARLPGTLPFPIQKRVALARALVARPQLILLDEPAGGLGGEDMRDLGERIRGLGGEMAVLLVEHHMDLVMSASDRVVVLDFGRRIAEGTPDEVRSDQRVLDAYLGVEVDAPG
jgi:branched-chain amino acid transport system ATP-binding protein